MKQRILSEVTSPSQTTVTEIKKVGTSEGVILTSQFRSMGLKSPDEVLVRVSCPSRKNEVIDSIADEIESGEYMPLNTSFREEYSIEEGYDVPSKFYGSRADDLIDQIQTIFENTVDYAIEFAQLRLNTNYAFFNPEKGEFIRTYPRSSFDDDDDETNLYKESLSIEFLKGLFEALSLKETRLKMTADIVLSIQKVMDAYQVLLSSGTAMSGFVDELNDQWDLLRKNTDSNVGFYVAVYSSFASKMHSTAEPRKYLGSSVRVVFALSDYTFRDSYAPNGNRFPQFPEDSIVKGTGLYGPLPKDKADEFTNYLNVALKMTPDLHTADSVKAFCRKEFDRFSKVARDPRRVNEGLWCMRVMVQTGPLRCRRPFQT